MQKNIKVKIYIKTKGFISYLFGQNDEHASKILKLFSFNTLPLI